MIYRQLFLSFFCISLCASHEREISPELRKTPIEQFIGIHALRNIIDTYLEQHDTLKVELPIPLAESEKLKYMHISPDNIHICALTDAGNLFLYNIKTEKFLSITIQKIQHAAFSSDGKQLACITNKSPYIIDLTDYTHTSPIDEYILPTGRLTLYSYDNKFVIYAQESRSIHNFFDLETNQLLKTINLGARNKIPQVIVSSDGKYIAQSQRGIAFTIDNILSGQKAACDIHKVLGSINYFGYARQDNYGALLVALPQQIHIFDSISGNIIQIINSPGITICAWNMGSKSSCYITGGTKNGNILTWHVNTGKLISTIKAHAKEIISLAYSQNGELLVSASSDGVIKLWTR
jgi:WD40 repeat protein